MSIPKSDDGSGILVDSSGPCGVEMYKILIVEDNDHFRQTLRSVLNARFPSMTFEEAREGREALEKVSAFDPDLIFMDIKLPGQNGLELTKRIRHSNAEVKIIILTSYDLPEYREAARVGGANHFVSKGSCKAEEILALVETMLSGTK
jgi:CheY-like chemotaxis protein